MIFGYELHRRKEEKSYSLQLKGLRPLLYIIMNIQNLYKDT